MDTDPNTPLTPPVDPPPIDELASDDAGPPREPVDDISQEFTFSEDDQDEMAGDAQRLLAGRKIAPSAPRSGDVDYDFAGGSAPQVSFPQRQDEIPMDIWFQEAVNWDSGQYECEIERIAPEKVYYNGKTHIVKGPLRPQFKYPPTIQELSDMFGGGVTMKATIWGPDGISRRGRVKAQRLFSIPGDPKPIGIVEENARVSTGEGVSTRIAEAGLQAVQRTAERAEGREYEKERRLQQLERERQNAVERAMQGASDERKELMREVLKREESMRKVQESAYEMQIGAMRSELSDLKQMMMNQHNQPPPVRDQGAQAGDMFTGLGNLLQGLAPKTNGHADGHALSDALNQERERHQRDLEALRRSYEQDKEFMRVQYDSAIKAAKEDAQARERDLRDRYQDGLREAEARGASDKSSMLETQKAAFAVAEAQKDARIESLKADLDTAKADLREMRQQRQELEKEVRDLHGAVARLEADLSIRPKPTGEDDFARLERFIRMKDKLNEALGQDVMESAASDEPKSFWEGLVSKAMESPEVGGMIQKVIGEFTGSNDKDRVLEKERMEKHLQAMQLQKEAQQQAIAAQQAVQQKKKRFAVPQAAPRPDSPVPEKPIAPSPDSPPQVDIAPRAPANLTGMALGLVDVLESADEAIRQGINPDVFADGMLQRIPAQTIKAQILDKYLVSDFLRRIASEGATIAFPALFTGVGNDWLIELWTQLRAKTSV